MIKISGERESAGAAKGAARKKSPLVHKIQTVAIGVVDFLLLNELLGWLFQRTIDEWEKTEWKEVALWCSRGLLALLVLRWGKRRWNPKTETVEVKSEQGVSAWARTKGSLVTLFWCSMALIMLIGCSGWAYENWRVASMMAGWRAEREVRQRRGDGDLREVLITTNFLLQPFGTGTNISVTVFKPPYLDWRVGPRDVRNEDVLVEHIPVNLVQVGTNTVPVPVYTNVVPFWSTNSYGMGTALLLRFTNKRFVQPRDIEVRMGNR